MEIGEKTDTKSKKTRNETYFLLYWLIIERLAGSFQVTGLVAFTIRKLKTTKS